MKSNGRDILKVNGRDEDEESGALTSFMLSHFSKGWENDPIRITTEDEIAPVRVVEVIREVIVRERPRPLLKRLRRRIRAARRRAASRTTIVEKSYDGPPKSVSELIDRLQGEGASPQLVLHTASLLAEKSYDARTTVVRCEPYETKKAYDRDYQKKRRAALKAAKKEAEKIVRPNDSEKRVTLKEIKIDTEEEVKETKKVRTSIVYSKDFDNFWLSYPRTPSMGKFEAYAVWKKIGPEERQLALAAVPKFAAWVKTQKPDYVVLHACRFLSKKRFEGFQEAVASTVDFRIPPWEREGITEDEWRKQRNGHG